MEGFEKYQKLMADWAKDRLSPYIKPESTDKMPEKIRIFCSRVFSGFADISATVDALNLAQILVSVAPPRSRKIQRDEYLKYQVNAYLQEVYILKERLIAYPKKLRRAYRGMNHEAYFVRSTQDLHKTVSDALSDIIHTRGCHVHSERFSDNDLDFLSQINLIARFDTKFEDAANFEYRVVKRSWGQRIKENNNETMKLLNAYFDCMADAVTFNGEVVCPGNPPKK